MQILLLFVLYNHKKPLATFVKAILLQQNLLSAIAVVINFLRLAFDSPPLQYCKFALAKRNWQLLFLGIK
ncbi:MAG: hypothetical protein IJV77_04280 [Clostridia bacterium]|nr:hypothetical protein [Clostridia bacterium]